MIKVNFTGLVRPRGFMIEGEESIQSCEVDIQERKIAFLPYDKTIPCVAYDKIHPLLECIPFPKRPFIPSNLPLGVPPEVWKSLVCPILEILGAIPKKDLVVGRKYKGKCRNSGTAIWKGDVFEYDRTKFGSTYKEEINHYEDDNGADLFIPYDIESESTED